MKKLTAGIFATILGLTAMGAADAASNVASTAYVKGAIESLDSEKAADEGKYISSIKMVDGKIFTIGEKALPTVDGFKTELDSSASAQAGYAVTGVTMTDGALTVSETKLFTNDDRDSAEKGAKEGYALSAVAMENGEFAIKEVALPTSTTLKTDLDSSASAQAGYAVTGVTMTDGALTVSETKLFTNDDRDSTAVTAQAGKYIAGVGMTDGALSITEGDLPTVAGFKAELDGTADAGAKYLLQSVTLTNGELAAGTKVEIVDSYPDTSLPLTPAI